jgi:hypothetical protein
MLGKEFSSFRRRITQRMRDKTALAPLAARFCGKQGEFRFKQMTRLAILVAM